MQDIIGYAEGVSAGDIMKMYKFIPKWCPPPSPMFCPEAD